PVRQIAGEVRGVVTVVAIPAILLAPGETQIAERELVSRRDEPAAQAGDRERARAGARAEHEQPGDRDRQGLPLDSGQHCTPFDASLVETLSGTVVETAATMGAPVIRAVV